MNETKDFLTPEDVAIRLGISVHTVYAKTSRSNRDHVKAEIPPFIKIGKLVRFPVTSYNQWLKEQTNADN